MKTKKPNNSGDAILEADPMAGEDLKLAMVGEHAPDDGMEGRLEQLTKVIALYNTPGSENRGQGFDKVKAFADTYGEPAYTVIVEKLAANGVEPVQHWILHKTRKWGVNQRVMSALVDMMPRDWDVRDHLGVVLAMNWKIAGEAVIDKIKKFGAELDRIEKPYNDLAELGLVGSSFKFGIDLPERMLQETDRAFLSIGGRDNIEAMGTALGLAPMVDEQESNRSDIFGALLAAAGNELLKYRILSGLRMAFRLVGKIEERLNDPYGPDRPSPYGLKIQKKYKTKRSELNNITKGLFGEFIDDERGEETTGHRRIERRIHKDSGGKKEIPTILKYCDTLRAQEEQHNFEILKSWGLPTPKVIGVSGDGIQVEDLTEGGAKILVMDEDGSFLGVLGGLSNSEELKKDMSGFASTLKVHGVDMGKLDRVLGLVIDKDKTGKLYFVDVDHIHLEKGRKKGK